MRSCTSVGWQAVRRVCVETCENWVYALKQCELYGDLKPLEHMGVMMHENGVVNVSGVLKNKETYECFLSTRGVRLRQG